MNERLYLFDTTLRDGAQTQGVDFTAADKVFIIGDGGMECVVIGTPNATMPVTPPPLVPQSTGARMVEAVAVSLGKIAEGSVSWTANRSLQAVFEEIGDTPVVYKTGSIEYGISFSLYGYNGPNVQFLSGYAEVETGDGAAYATAYQSIAGLPSQSYQTEQVLRVQGIREDAVNLEIDFNRAFVEANLNSPLGRNQPAILNCNVKASSVIIRQWS